jgi:hypothetical protein
MKQMARMILEHPKQYIDDPLSWHIRFNLSQNKNTMVAALGRPRSGKSMSLLTMGEMCDARHDFDTSHVAFYPQDYIYKISTFKRGCFVVFDEPGAEWSARRFMSIQNIMLGATHITFGSRLINVGWAVPVLKMQDVTAARLMNFFHIMQLPPHPVGTARFFRNWVDEYTGKTGRELLGYIAFAMPFQLHPEERKKYEQMKKDYQDKSYEEYYIRFAEQSKGRSASGKLSLEEMREIAKEIIKTPRKYIVAGKIRAELIQADHNLRQTEARQIKLMVEKYFADHHIDIREL